MSSFLTIDLSAENLTLIISVFLAIVGGVFWLGILHNKLNSLEKDVRQLKNVTNDLYIKLNAYLLAREELDKMTMGSSLHKPMKGDNDDSNE